MRIERRHRDATAGLVATISALLVLTACGGIVARIVGDDDLPLFVHGPQLPSGGTDAEILGTLTTRDGCILLMDDDGTQFPVVWPVGTSLEATEPLVIELPSGEQVREGDRISGAGGYPYADTLGIDVADACLNEWGEVAVFNPGDEPIVVAR